MKLIKNTFKYGLGLLIPIALVLALVVWLYNEFTDLTLLILPDTLEFQWWFPLVVLLSIIIVIFIIGFIFKYITPIRWVKNKIERYIIKKIPIINKVYDFGTELSDSFISDIKENGDMQVVEVSFGGFKMLGVLTDEKNSLGFILSAPSPLTGVVMKLPNWEKLNMSFIDAVKINTSLGRINGDRWNHIDEKESDKHGK